jgi:hypothetical protein
MGLEKREGGGGGGGGRGGRGGGENLKKQAKPANSPGRPLGKRLARREAVIRATSVLKTKIWTRGGPPPMIKQ